MNILIPHSWLKDYLETKATPQKIAECFSLCGTSVEKINKVGNDYVYDIEITTNRIDMASIQGIAREAAAILPRFGIKAKFLPLTPQTPKIPKKSLPLKVKIKNPSLCPRFTAVILDNITIKPSPRVIQERLDKSGVRALNNVIDVSNYLMIELGQPMHTFDYDKIKGAKMILRESKRGEKITTLDEQTRTLPHEAIIIEDGGGRIIDLCGIMGAKNSEVNQNNNRVLLFVQTYNPIKIRKACQSLAFRTEAASRFEKGVDPKGVIPAMKKAILIFKKNCDARIASKLIDIYPHPLKPKKVTLTEEKLNQIMGIKIDLSEAKGILDSLGFQSTINNQSRQSRGSPTESRYSRLPAESRASTTFVGIVESHRTSIEASGQSTIVTLIPHWRYDDVSIPEDLIEEIARIYGYHNLPTRLPTGEFPKSFKDPFSWEEKTKDCLKNWGFTEVYNYSMVSSGLLEKTGFNPQSCLKLSNPLTSEWEYMRPSLIPGILKTIVDNQSREEKFKIFELSNIYLPRKNDLPNEKIMLAGALTGEKFYQAKGVAEALLEELGITSTKGKGLKICPAAVCQIFKLNLWHPGRTAVVFLKKRGKSLKLGTIGEIHPQILEKLTIEERVTLFELDFEEVLKHTTTTKSFVPIPKYPPIVEDLAFIVSEKTLVGKVMEEMKKASSLVANVSLLDSYQNTRTFRIAYQHPKRTLRDKEVKKIREKIIKKVSKKFKADIKL